MTKHMQTISRVAALSLVAASTTGCNMDTLVRATDPDVIGTEQTTGPTAPNAMRIGTLGRFNAATTGGESMFLYGGLFGDEMTTGDTFTQRIETDQRALTPENANLTTAYRGLHLPRISAIQTRDALAKYSIPAAPAWNFSEMFFVEAYMLNLLAEHFCNGQPISYIKDSAEELGSPMMNTEIFALAMAKVDSGITRLGAGTTANEVRVRHALSLLKARILLNQGNFAAVQAAVADVPTSYVWLQEHALTSRTPGMWALVNNQRRYIVSNNEGPLGLNFGTANDPRVPTCTVGQPACVSAGFTTNRPFDSTNGAVPAMRYQLIWPTDASSVALMSGLQARLFEAEALNQGGNFAGALTILNALRATPPGYNRTITAMTALADPGTPAARRDMIFREKAFWLYGTGHRYPDMRRMMRQYGMTQNEVFPNGAWQINRAPGYGTDVVFRTVTAESFNKNVPQSNGAPVCTNTLP